MHARHDLPRVHADRPKPVTVMIQADDHHVHVLRVSLLPVHEETPQAPELDELRQVVGEAKGLVGRLTASQLVGRRGQAVVDVRRKHHRVEEVLLAEAARDEVAPRRLWKGRPHALDAERAVLGGARRVELVDEAAEQRVELGLGVALGRRELPTAV